MCFAHDHALSGRLGVNKTFSCISRYFYWPGLKSAVSEYCRSCHVCQLAWKPNRAISNAPLHPIPVLSEPFERIIDCVGPLPKTKSGFQYLLTLMCAATRYPEAIVWLLSETKPQTSLLEYVSSFRERLHQAREVALSELGLTQTKMKTRFDKKSVYRSFLEGDLVLVFLPLPGSPLQAQFSGPYTIKQRLSDTDYVINTPDRKRKTRVCHINMLKVYVNREGAQRDVDQNMSKSDVPISAVTALYCPEEDGLKMRDVSCARLDNSTFLE